MTYEYSWNEFKCYCLKTGPEWKGDLEWKSEEIHRILEGKCLSYSVGFGAIGIFDDESYFYACVYWRTPFYSEAYLPYDTMEELIEALTSAV